MTRFFFNLRDGTDLIDEDGIELPDLATAERRARDLAQSMAAVEIQEDGRLAIRNAIEVAGETGELLYRVTFGEVIEIVR